MLSARLKNAFSGRCRRMIDEADDHPDEAGEHELVRRAEEQADHQRQLVHRERVRVVADLHVYGEAVGEREARLPAAATATCTVRAWSWPGCSRPRRKSTGGRGGERGREEDDLAVRHRFGPRVGSRLPSARLPPRNPLRSADSLGVLIDRRRDPYEGSLPGYCQSVADQRWPLQRWPAQPSPLHRWPLQR